MSEQLPSIDDFYEELPSVEEVIKEENLPSVDEFIEEEPPRPEEEIADALRVEEIEPEDVQDLTEVVRLINDVRRDIPNIPEIKYYDEPLQKLSEYVEQIKESIPEIPEIKEYDNEVEAICEQIDLVREEIKDLPEVKYYDDQVTLIEDRIDNLQTEVTNLPEVKYYDAEIEAICEAIDEVKAAIPKFPKWVNEVNQVPDFSWIGKTFGVIDDDFVKVNDHIEDLKTKFDFDIDSLAESLDTKDFERRGEVNKLQEDLKETKEKIWEELRESAVKVWEYQRSFKDDDRKLKKSVLSKLNETKQKLETQIDEFNANNTKSNETLTDYFKGLKEEISNLPQPKNYDDPITDLKKNLFHLEKKREEQGINITELYKIVEDLKGTQQELREIYNNRPITPDPKLKQGKDPLTPTNQEFATLKDLAANYRLFVNRVEQQLYTIGGGGAGFLKDLADVNISGLKEGNTLVWNADTSMWDVGQGVGAGGTWASNAVGIHTTKSVGIGTTTASSDYALYVDGDAYYTGNISAAGTITYEDVVNIDSLGIITGRSDLNILGNARIVGVLTAGESSITIDGDNNQIVVGGEDNVTITASQVTIGTGVTISSSASGINSAPNVIYVAKDGQETNNGTSIDNAFLTISGAVGVAQSGTTVKVLSGKYAEANPIEVPAFVSIVGDDQRTVEVSGLTTTNDIFHVRKGSKLANMTFKDHEAPAAAVAFPTGDDIAENVGGGKWKGPYIQNCTSDTTTGIGCYIDGDQAQLLKAMNIDAFTQYNQGGVGVAVTNGGFAQLVSLFTICCNEAVTCDKGGQADIANSNCSFGTYGLVARGTSDLQYTGVVTSSAAVSQANIEVNVNTPEFDVNGFSYHHTSGIATVSTTAAHGFLVGMGVTISGIGMTCTYGTKDYPYRMPFIFEVEKVTSTTFTINVGISTVAHTYVSGGKVSIDVDRPYDGQLAYFDTLYNRVQTITVTDGGSGYTLTPTVTVADPTGPTGETCTAYATLSGNAVSTITIISSGSQYTSAPNVTISGGGGSGATATASIQPIYYTINSSTPVTAGISTLTLQSNLLNTVGVGSTAYFSQGSRIVASSHTFEYVGAGNRIAEATPKRGGVTTQANEVITEDGGKVLYTSTDQAGNFRIGDDLQINQETGTISGRSFSKSLFSEMTPFILALS